MSGDVKYTVREICLLGDFSKLRKYKPPSEMEWLGGIGTTRKEEETNLIKYGIIDRRWKLKKQLVPESKTKKSFQPWNNFILDQLRNPQFNQNFFGDTPHFFLNLGTLKQLGCPNAKIKLFKVRKIKIPNVGSILKVAYHYWPSEVSTEDPIGNIDFDIQRLLAENYEIRGDESFTGVYASKLSKSDDEGTNKEIRILLTNSLDGVRDYSWTAYQPSQELCSGLHIMNFKKEDIVKIIKYPTTVFYQEKSPYFYENILTRKTFLNAYLIGSDSIYCGVFTKYEKETILKEVWEQDVSELEKNPEYPPNWDQRRFPKSIFSKSSAPRNTFLKSNYTKSRAYEKWTKEECLDLQYLTLSVIREEMDKIHNPSKDEDYFYLYYSFRGQPMVAHIDFTLDDCDSSLQRGYLTEHAVELKVYFPIYMPGSYSNYLWEIVQEVLDILGSTPFECQRQVEEIGNNTYFMGLLFKHHDEASEFLRICKTRPTDTYGIMYAWNNQIGLKIYDFAVKQLRKRYQF